jgi:hypothetical protein
MNDDDIKGVLIEILHMGLLRIRALGNSGDAEACSLEADHLHNLPELVRSFRWELLHFYFTVERHAFLSSGPRGPEQFSPLWDRLGILIETKSLNNQELKAGQS